MNKSFLPDYNNVLDAAYNRSPRRLPLYEHIIDPGKMEEIQGQKFTALINEGKSGRREFFRHFCQFYRVMGYDTVSYECCINSVIFEGKALCGFVPGPVQNREDFDRFPFDEAVDRYFELFDDHFQALGEQMPPGMKGIGGVGNGVFEIAQDLVGFVPLCMMRDDDPELYADVFTKVGDLMIAIWSQLLKRHGDTYAVCRFGDDLGFKTSTLMTPNDIRTHILPQYRRIAELIHAHGKPFLLHSCGCIFDVMEDIINVVGIDAKHSNEDQIAPFQTWVDRYGDRIGNFGGVDLNILCLNTEQEIRNYVRDVIKASEGFRGIAIGSGNSIPDYVPAAGYLAMVEAVREYRGD